MKQIAKLDDDEFVCLLVGNKKDDEEQRKVTEDDVQHFLQQHGRVIGYIEVSAFTGENVANAFETLQKAITFKAFYKGLIRLDNGDMKRQRSYCYCSSF